jgi:hypothetical protein
MGLIMALIISIPLYLNIQPLSGIASIIARTITTAIFGAGVKHHHNAFVILQKQVSPKTPITSVEMLYIVECKKLAYHILSKPHLNLT